MFSDFLQAPELPADAVHREGVLLDVDCPDAADILIKVKPWIFYSCNCFFSNAEKGVL